MKCLIITNNPQVPEQFPPIELLWVEGSVLDLYSRVRDYIHKGHRLLTHPLCGSMKPGEIPYKSVVLSGERQNPDLLSLQLIENSIENYHKTFRGSLSGLAKDLLNDYAAVDLSHLEAALEGFGS